MMHVYLAFDKDGNQLAQFRTWRNANTTKAAEELTELFQFNIPERWPISHLYQCILDNEEHVSKVDFFTTLAGYVHWELTCQKFLVSAMLQVCPQLILQSVITIKPT